MNQDSRRRFLQSAAGVAAAGSLAAQPQGAAQLPTVAFGKHKITRLVIGSNPFYGYSHFNSILDQHMREWYTPDKRMEVLRRCESQGIGAWQLHYNKEAAADIKRYLAEGGTMKIVLLADSDLMTNPKLLPEVAKMGVIGIAHHGGVTDRRFREGEKDKVRDFLKAVRDTGVMVGLSTHNPAVVDSVESMGWDLDYYMTCLYRVTRTPEEIRAQFGEAPLGEPFFEKDPERMCKMIRQTKRTCLAFKLMGAGRNIRSAQQIESVYRFVYQNIKPGDAAIVGMYPRWKDEPKENAAMVRKVLAG